MALKQCPLWVIAGILPEYVKPNLPLQNQNFKNALSNDYPVFNCKGGKCQMWSEQTNDCGLKQTPVTPILTKIKSTLDDISQDVEIIKNNVE